MAQHPSRCPLPTRPDRRSSTRRGSLGVNAALERDSGMIRPRLLGTFGLALGAALLLLATSAKPARAVCVSGAACTLDSQCTDAVNPCKGRCNGMGGTTCVCTANKVNGTACDNGNACTPDTCQTGVCTDPVCTTTSTSSTSTTSTSTSSTSSSTSSTST